jgi:hypothetical protein
MRILNGLPNAPFVLDETFVYYDGPMLFSARSEKTPLVAIVNSVEEEDDGSIIWLVALISETELKRVRSGFSPLYETFTDAFDGTLFVLCGENDEASPIKSSELPKKWLPEPDARLGVHDKEKKTDA